jgi:tripartite-type tricarboxylate transporter receptor subunit TctC
MHIKKLYLLIFTLFVLISHANAQIIEYPNKTIRIIVGPGSDVLARMLAEKLTEAWGQPVIIEAKPAAGGIVAGDTVAKSIPDGYTLLLSSSSFTANHALQPKMPYDITTDLRPVSLLATIPIVIVANPSLHIQNLKELVQVARLRPDQLNFGSAGNGTAPHLAGEMFKQKAAISLIHIPYKGAVPAVTDLLGGQVQIMFAVAPSVLPMIQAKKLQALGVTGIKRYKGLPDVHSAGEQGFPDFSYIAWNGIHAPIKTPTLIIEKLSLKIAEIMQTSIAKDRAEKAGFEVLNLNFKDFEQFQEQDLIRLRAIIKEGNIKPD